MPAPEGPNPFFDHPILNSPYECPRGIGSSTNPASQRSASWRVAAALSSSRRSRSRRNGRAPPPRSYRIRRREGAFHEGTAIRSDVDHQSGPRTCRPVACLTHPNHWQVTPETARLLQHWRHHNFSGIRPFFCQVEAVETAIWLTEVAPHVEERAATARPPRERQQGCQPGTAAHGAEAGHRRGKTTVMAMLIAWQTVNAVRRPGSKHFTRGFLVVAPGLTIKDRLRVLQPNDPDAYYAEPRARPGRHAGGCQ